MVREAFIFAKRIDPICPAAQPHDRRLHPRTSVLPDHQDRLNQRGSGCATPERRGKGDRCLVPKPFSRIVVRWGQLITVPKDMDERAFEEIRLGIEKEMLLNQRINDYRFGGEDLI